MIDLALQKQMGRPEKGGFFLDVTLSLPPECRSAVFFGPSGSGKTLTLRALAGLLHPDAGHIRIAGKKVFDAREGVNMPARQRRIGYMFQDYALFPHLSVLENVAFGLGLAGMALGRRERREQVMHWLNFLEIHELAARKPAALSGGQRQRAALARALAAKPGLLLLDEPFSALDPLLRDRLRKEFGDMLRKINLPTLLITHDPADVQAFAEYLAIFDQGRVQRVLPCQNLFAGISPAEALAAAYGQT